LRPVIQPANPNYNYSWQPSSGLSCNDCQNPIASPLVTTPYELTVFDEHGCRYSEQIIIDVTNNLIILVPNAFTPNGDGVNDVLNVYGISLAEIDFKVFDRWGEKMFETKNLSDGWDGRCKGKKMPPGVYVYYVKAVFNDGQEKQIKGSTTILQ
jgi:gliding motility-associated-like protein